jgi:hypothetical protein
LIASKSSPWRRVGRKAKEMVFDYDKTWLGKRYAQKKVKVVFAEGFDRIVVIAVYVFYGTWR